jgi:soluble lytic murein transglycosylase-like protein
VYRANYFQASLSVAAAALALALVSAPALAGANVYRYVDPAGVPHYANLPIDHRYRLLRKGPASTARSKPMHQARWVQRAPGYANVPAEARPYHAEIEVVSREHGIESALVHAVVTVESNYNARATSRAGAIGLMQLMPATAARYGVASIRDARGNLDGGVRYLRDLLAMFGGDLRLALAAYNAGEEAVMRFGMRIPPFRETQAYVPKVIAQYRSLRRAAIRIAPPDTESIPPVAQLDESGSDASLDQLR